MGRRRNRVAGAGGREGQALRCPIPDQDVSSNELQALPTELCSLPGLRDLNVRRNQLGALPDGEAKGEQGGAEESLLSPLTIAMLAG